MSSKEPATQYYHHGRLRVAGDPKKPCVVFPTCYGGKLDHRSYLVGEDKVLNTDKFFVVTFALFSNGESSSPSNTPAPYNGPYFPAVSYEDNIRAQHAVLTKKLGISKVRLVIGFSMGGQQAYYWPVVFPDYVERFVPICGSARTSPHNKCFLEGPQAALTASKDFHDGHYTSPPQYGIRAFGRAYSAWAYGQTWFRQRLYISDAHPDMESWLREDWEGGFLTEWDANDMLTLLHTWYTGDVSLVRDGGDYEQCLKSIKAKGLIMPCKTDLYFPPEDSEIEVSLMTNGAKLVVIDSVWGHVAGGDANPEDTEFIQAQIQKFLDETA
ncbi:alpha/beta hydrolase fold protein [Punctularia strigosozonata HHB-11173 SS5]|uniref:alpha/beta hydrolase fold protein n=1 Tax=Punctularia strigosozonata (strain HHB-11173) TaxID=741275 RepID=UPI0004417A63|nr:alpha/beta hydrolase fold protein [Punctularia strigosozonata HHB-11173 SS5]EIN14643.1 alpha/beta hydrolase fold protein [Punctularia strigosozonata HHB-11173 SS5]